MNLLAVAWLCRAAIPEMRRAGHGAIVNVSSKAAVRGTPGLAAYSASKGALEALTRSIAMDHAADNVRCNAIGLGYVLNERRDAEQQRPDTHAEYAPEYDASRHRLPVDEFGARSSPWLAVQRLHHGAYIGHVVEDRELPIPTDEAITRMTGGHGAIVPHARDREPTNRASV